MGTVFEELIRKLAELSNETAGGHLATPNPEAQLVMLGQELNPESYAICKADMLIKGQEIENIVFGNTRSGESEMRRHMLENDMVEAIIALQTDMFYNTGIATYVRIVSNRKPVERKGTVRGKGKGKPVAGSALRDTANIPLARDVEEYFEREVLPHAPDAWIEHEKTRIGFEISFNRHFYVLKPPRPLSEIDAELKVVTNRTLQTIGGVTH